MILLTLSFLANLYFFSYGYKGDKCLANPLVYGALKVEKSFPEAKGMFCRCEFGSPSYAPFWFTKNGLINNDPQDNSSSITKNVNDLFVK